MSVNVVLEDLVDFLDFTQHLSLFWVVESGKHTTPLFLNGHYWLDPTLGVSVKPTGWTLEIADFVNLAFFSN